MKTTKISHIIFSLAVIAALMLAAVPMAPAHAMSASAEAQTSIAAAGDSTASLSAAGAVVCTWRNVWRNGHWVRVRVCHRVNR